MGGVVFTTNLRSVPILPEIRGGVKWKMWFCRTPAMSILAVSYSIAIFPSDTLKTGLFGDSVIALREAPAELKTSDFCCSKSENRVK